MSATAFQRSTEPNVTEATESLQKCKCESECEPDTHLIRVVHRKGDAGALEVVHVDLRRDAAVRRAVHQLELARSWCQEV